MPIADQNGGAKALLSKVASGKAKFFRMFFSDAKPVREAEWVIL